MMQKSASGTRENLGCPRADFFFCVNSGLTGRDYLLSLEKESSKETSNRQRKTKRQKPTQREIRQK